MNQRFIEDIEELNKQQTNITNINIANKFDHLEQTILKLEQKCEVLEKSQSSLTTNCSQLEGSLHTLEEKNSSLKDSYFNLEGDYSHLQQKFIKLEESSSQLQEQVVILERNEKLLKEEIDKLKEGNQDTKDKFVEINTFRDQQVKSNLIVEEKLSKHQENSITFKQELSVLDERIDNVERANTSFETWVKDSNVGKRLDELEHSDENFVERLNKIETEAEKSSQLIKDNTEGMEKNRQDIDKMIALQNNTKQMIESLEGKSTETWDNMTSFISKHNETIRDINEMISLNQTNFTTIETKLKDLDKTNEHFNTQLIEMNKDTIKNFDELVGKQNDVNQNLMTNVKNALESSQQQIQTNLGIVREENVHNIQQVNEQMKYTNEKIFRLEEAQQQQLQKNQYFDNLNNRINTLDEMRQQSEARARDEVDATISQNNKAVEYLTNDLNTKFEKIELMVKQEQSLLSKFSDGINADLNGLKDDAVQMNKKLNEVHEANRKVFNDLDQNLNSKLKKYEEIHTSELEKIETQIQESTFIQAERVSQFENLEAQLHTLEKNLSKIENNNTKAFTDILEQNKALEAELKKGGDSINDIQRSVDSSVAVIQKELGGKLQELENETKKNSLSLVEIEPVAKTIDGRFEGIKQQIIIENNKHFESFKSEVSTTMMKVTEKNNTVEKHFETIKDNSEKIKEELKEILKKDQENIMNEVKIMKEETDQAIKSSDVLINSMVEKIQSLELSDKNSKLKINEFENLFEESSSKLSNLESADLFLQEAHRLLTEKSTKLEADLVSFNTSMTEAAETQNADMEKKMQNSIDNLRAEADGTRVAIEKLNKKIPGRINKFYGVSLIHNKSCLKFSC